MCPLPNSTEVSACVFAIAVEVLGGKRCQIALTHDLLANVVDTVTIVDSTVERT